MIKRLRKLSFSIPALAAAVLFALYLVLGFLVLPAVLKSQIEQRAPELLGQRISIGALRFNPLTFRLDAADLLLAAPDGTAMLGAKRLLVDFELRSAIDRAWTFAEARLEAPVLSVEREKDGRHNFAAMLEHLAAQKTDEDDGPPPQWVVQRLVVSEGRVEFSDRLLDDPLVARIEALQVEVDNLSNLMGQTARYQVSARTAQGEMLELNGELGLNPLAANGRLTTRGIKLATPGRALSRQFALGSAQGQIDLAASFDISLASTGVIAGNVREIELALSSLLIKAPGTEATLAAVETLALTQGRIDLGQREASFGDLRLEKGRIAAIVDADGAIDWSKLARSSDTAPSPSAAANPWRLSVAKVAVANIDLVYADAARGLSVGIDSLELGVALDAESGPSGIKLQLQEPALSLAGARLTRVAESAGLGSASLAGKQLLLAQNDKGLDISIIGARLSLAELSAQRGPARLTLGKAELAANRLAVPSGDGPVDLIADGLDAEIGGVAVRDSAAELLRLEKANVSGASLHLLTRQFSADRFTLANGKLRTGFDAQGKFNWQSLLDAVTGDNPAKTIAASRPEVKTAVKAEATMAATSTSMPAARSKTAAATTNWRFKLKSGQIDGMAVAYVDQRESPAVSLGLEAISARTTDLDSESTKPLQLAFRTRLAGGGEVEAKGKLRIKNSMADLKLGVRGVALAPLQPYLSKFADLRIAGGTLSAAGRLRHGSQADADATLVYTGGFSIDQALLEEIEPARPFLAWGSIASDDLLLTLSPNRLDIGELRLQHPSGRLIIGEDQKVNLAAVLKKPTQAKAAEKVPGATYEPDTDRFPLSISRLAVSGGAIEFADLSLRPQFGIRMHELQGVVIGLGNDPERSAKLQIDARVDNYGTAKIRGQFNPMRPERFTEIDMGFRNLEMTALSPYVAKFAGYRIASGQLELDLQYRVRENKLQGENKIVLKQVELGEKVESPDALDLPLELAIAILKDGDGVIDVGIPVSGDLSDPQFNYGAVIGKAFGALLGGIVTAPFRALAALFGGGEKPLDSIDFEPGSAALAPPERQKLAVVARALKARPTLRLTVPPAYAATEDAAALKSIAIRTEILRGMGVVPPPDADPGPLDIANPRTRRAIETAFSERYAPEVLAALRRRAEAARPAAAGAGQAAAQPEPALFHQDLLERLISESLVDDKALVELAARRSQAVIKELIGDGGVAGDRVVSGKTQPAAGGEGKSIALPLKLEVGK
ncbi:MAG: DUF748 domain-containing protein [Polynucleobacter sp.]|nr:DUF748 domain-containing protein [Polynucleobacter sp.]